MATGGNNGLKKAVAFLAGLSLYQLLYLAFSTAKYTLVRFQIPQRFLSMYINRMIMIFRVLSLLGISMMTIYVQCQGPQKKKTTAGLFAIFSSCFVYLLAIYCTGGEQGHLTLYCWGISIASFVLGACFTTIVDIVTADVVLFLLSLPLTGVITSLYHILFLVISKYFKISNVNYWLVVFQIIIAMIINLLHVVLYFCSYWSEEDDAGGDGNTDNFGPALGKAWSPILMITLGYGIHNAFYPGLAPYKFTNVRNAYNIDLVVLCTSAMAPLFILILKVMDMGPNRAWSGNHLFWHGAWLFFFTEVACIVVFISGIHYPEWAVSQRIRKSVKSLGIITIIYDFSAQAVRSIATNGADMQGGKSNSKMNTFNTFSYSVTQVIFSSMGDGYLKTYVLYENDRDKWPTKHFGRLRSFWFWTWNATVVASKTIATSFCTDVRATIQSKKEYLFIVYTNG